MEREFFVTGDGSHSVRIKGQDLSYHSIHGAIQESMHVFIESGLRHLLKTSHDSHDTGTISILEMGFGTGLNALLTYIDATQIPQNIHYTCIENEPISGVEARQLNFCGELGRTDLDPYFHELHDSAWETNALIHPAFILHKMNTDLEQVTPAELLIASPAMYHLIYFDAFAPTAQPQLWTTEIFQKLASVLRPGGVLVTYCSKGEVKRSLLAAGFAVEKIPGPPHKREMLRAKRL